VGPVHSEHTERQVLHPHPLLTEGSGYGRVEGSQSSPADHNRGLIRHLPQELNLLCSPEHWDAYRRSPPSAHAAGLIWAARR